jgi:hypothetical protein
VGSGTKLFDGRGRQEALILVYCCFVKRMGLGMGLHGL